MECSPKVGIAVPFAARRFDRVLCGRYPNIAGGITEMAAPVSTKKRLREWLSLTNISPPGFDKTAKSGGRPEGWPAAMAVIGCWPVRFPCMCSQCGTLSPQGRNANGTSTHQMLECQIRSGGSLHFVVFAHHSPMLWSSSNFESSSLKTEIQTQSSFRAHTFGTSSNSQPTFGALKV